jgi:hypothetical protein
MEAKDMLTLPDDEFRAHVVEYLVAHDAAISENTLVTRQVAEDTAFIRSILADVAAGARLLCRLAATWRFLIRQVVLPIGLPLLCLYVLYLVGAHRPIPEWAVAIFKLVG